MGYPCAGNHTHPSFNEIFTYNDGIIRLQAEPSLHFNVAGADLENSSSKLVLWNCQPGRNEVFELDFEGRLRLKQAPGLCLNVQGGLAPGRPLIVWHCDETTSV